MIPLRDSQPSHSFPAVTGVLIVINVLVFLYQFSLDDYSLNVFFADWAMIPARFQVSGLVTSMFLHGGWMHLIGNMWFLWIFGDNVEDVLGRMKYVVFYLASGVAASAAHLISNPNSDLPSVGASGAIAGVMGAYLLKFPHARIVTLLPIIIFFTTIEVPAWLMLVYWFVIQIFSGFGDIASSTGATKGGVAWFAHIGGFLAGMALVTVLRPHERYRHRADYRW